MHSIGEHNTFIAVRAATLVHAASLCLPTTLIGRQLAMLWSRIPCIAEGD